MARRANRTARLRLRVPARGSTSRRIERHPTPTQREELNRWDEFEDQLTAAVRERNAPAHRRPPFDTARGYLKREVYRYVCERLEKKAAVALEWCIEEARGGRQPRRPSFKENPFHWVLLGLQDNPELNLKKGEVSRFGRQLLYGRRHKVPPELLIGFIYQTGSPALINRKLADDERESWFNMGSN